ncbi:MAG: hypothetical protein RL456_66 [Pseudomonadota bacterium]
MTLRFERARPGPAAPPGVLAWRRFAARPPGAGPDASGLPWRLDDGGPDVVECWRVEGAPPPQDGRTGRVTHRRVGPWLHACAVADTGAAAGTPPHDLAPLARQLYADLFAVLDAQGLHPLKLWNYLPHINAEPGGLEVYRAFNIGRQQAFLDAGRQAFDGAPAACALGHHGGPLRVECLAGPAAPRAVENPRQVSAYRYPAAYGPRSPTFSRAALADTGAARPLLFISGTASIVGHATLHAGDVARQTEETLRNLEAVLASAQAGSGARHDLDRLDLTLYLRDPADRPVVARTLARHLGEAAPALRGALWLQADICRADLAVEIEAQGEATR